MRAHGAAHLEISAGSTRAAAIGARVASVPEAEADPESLASLWMLRRRDRNTQHQQRHDHCTAARDVPHWVPQEEERGPIFEIAELIAMPGYVQTRATLAALRHPAVDRRRHFRLRGAAARRQTDASLVQPGPRDARQPDRQHDPGSPA